MLEYKKNKTSTKNETDFISRSLLKVLTILTRIREVHGGPAKDQKTKKGQMPFLSPKTQEKRRVVVCLASILSEQKPSSAIL